MNKRQRLIVIWAAALAVVMLLFPPFHFQRPQGLVFNLGYGFLFDPPMFQSLAGSVNIAMLLVQWAALVALAAVLWWVTKGDQK